MGDYSTKAGVFAFLATPDAPTDAPEPATWILFVTGLAAAAMWRRARMNA